jgi:CheY-like chemotaxis protein
MTGFALGSDPLPVLQSLFTDATVAALITAASPSSGLEGPPIVFANAAMVRLTGHNAKSLFGRGCLTLLDDSTEATALARVRAAVYGSGHTSLDVWSRRAEGPPYPVRWDIMPYLDARGDVFFRAILAHDLMGQRRAEAALSELRSVARRAGHDLNNAMAGLLVNLTPAQGPGLTEAQRDVCLRDALDAVRGATQAVRRLLDAARDDERTTAVLEGLPVVAQTAGRATHDASEVATEVTKAHQAAARARGALLILDDDEKVLGMMAGFLQHAGYYVSATSDPGQCIARYREAVAEGRCYDLVILDLMMEDRRAGLATLAALQAIDPDVRAIAHSGSAYADVMTAPTLHGFVAAIEKPSPLSNLAATVDALLRAAP